jgi:hypothetical protein
MTVTSISRIVVPSLALVATFGAALVFGIAHVRRQPPVEVRSATAVPAVSMPASGARDEGATALATAKAGANTGAAALAVSPRSPGSNEFVPVFDIARIERTGDAVIAGRVAPGAIVELLRNGERHDRVVADQSGQFVMVPPRLPPGNYELTLRSGHPDGKQATSKQNVVVALDEVEFRSAAVSSRAEVPQTVGQAHQRSQPPLQIAKPQDIADSLHQHATAATPLPDGGSQDARFAAISLTRDQGVRAIISNVLAPAKVNHLAACQVQVTFFGADGSLIGNATTVQVKAGESTSVSASNPSKLVRAIVSIGDVVDPAKVCVLRTSVEIFDVQTGTTFVSLPGVSMGSNSECSVSVAPVLRTKRKNTRAPVLAATAPTAK